MRNRVKFALVAIFATLGLAFSVAPASAADVGTIYLNQIVTSADLDDTANCKVVDESNRIANGSLTKAFRIYANADANCLVPIGTAPANQDTTFPVTFTRYSVVT